MTFTGKYLYNKSYGSFYCTIFMTYPLNVLHAHFRKTAIQYGMFHQIRVDGGKEFYLTLGMQETFSGLRNREDILPYKQTQSKKVNI